MATRDTPTTSNSERDRSSSKPADQKLLWWERNEPDETVLRGFANALKRIAARRDPTATKK